MRLLFIAFAAASLSASTLTVSESGTFSSSVPYTMIGSNDFTAPGDTWSYSFNVDSMPTVSGVSLGNYFNVQFTDFTYTLDGFSIPLTADEITVFSSAQGGLFQICFTGSCDPVFGPQNGLSLFGPAIYTGSESSPTIMPGSYAPTTLDFVVNGGALSGIPAGPVNIAPEPSSVTLFACGSALLLCMLARKRKRA